MAIEKEYGKQIPVCDGCLTTLDPCDTFQDALDECRENEWHNVKVNGSWQNRCPKCYREYCATMPRKKLLDW